MAKDISKVSSDEIAERIGCHSSNISHIIKRMLVAIEKNTGQVGALDRARRVLDHTKKQ